jgi:transcriptional regulator with XRE-family HTH domain
LPFCHLTFRAGKPKDSRYPKEIRTIGDRLRQRRLNLGLLQREVAKELKVSPSTVRHWELGQKEPKLQYQPTLRDFLGEGPPVEPAATFPQALRAARRAMGLSQKRLAELVGFGCPDTVADWESGVRTPMPRHLERLRLFFQKAGQSLAFVDSAAKDFAARRSAATSRAWATRRARRRV